MQKLQTILVSLYDAMPEHAHFQSPIAAAKAKTLGAALAAAGISIIARPATPLVMAVFSALAGRSSSIALSPASSREEHEHAFRMLFPEAPMVFAGRGAIGTDAIAMASGESVLILGSYPEVFEGILDRAKEASLPIAVLTDEAPESIHERVRVSHQHLAASLMVSHDPEVLVRSLAEELRRRKLSKRHAQ